MTEAPPLANRDASERGADVRPGAMGRNFSYFSHRVFVAFRPVDLHNYLIELLELVPSKGGLPDPAEQIDHELVRWVLIHRSQMNALSLNRLIESLRGRDDMLQLANSGELRNRAYRIDITLQFAIECALADQELSSWLDKRPRLRQAALDAAYYVSREWDDQDRAMRVADSEAKRENLLDLGADGKKAFRAYLLHRMNLYEDLPTAVSSGRDAQREVDRVHFESLALSEKELDGLYALPLRVAHTVAFSQKKPDALRRQWESLVHANPAGALSSPGSAVFESLLLGENLSVLVPTGGDHSLQFRWRYLPSAGDSRTTTVQSVYDNAKQALETIRSAEAALFAALDFSAKDAPPTAHPLYRLGERYRVLPATPPWTSVTYLRNRLESAKEGVGDLSTLPSYGSDLRAYAADLGDGDSKDAAYRALVCAAALEGLLNGGSHDRSLSRGLDALSDGLDFSGCLLSDVQGRLVQFQKELEDYLGRPLPLPDVTWDYPDWNEDLSIKVQAAFDTARSLGSDLPSPIEEAWAATAARLHALATGDTSGLASLAEIVCSVRGEGPGTLLDLKPERMTLRRWTSLLLRTLADRSRQASPPRATPPLRMAVYALERLGMRAASAQAQHTVLKALTRTEDVEASALRQLVFDQGLWEGPRRALPVAIVICSDRPSLTDSWLLPPTSGLVFVATLGDARLLLDGELQRFFSSHAESIRLAWEPSNSDPVLEEALRKSVQSAAGKNEYQEEWLYRSVAPGQRDPKRIDVGSADELFDSLPTS